MSVAVPVRRRVAFAMGMPISLALRGRCSAGREADDAWAEVMACLDDVDRVFSTYRDDSLISRLGRGELAVEDCPPDVREVLAIGERARRESDGAFDVRRPAADGSTVLDPSGVVKGWAVERAAEPLRRLPDTDFCLSAGGDMVCRVANAGAPAWRIGIEDPRDATRLTAVVPLLNGAVATSGLAHRGAHIVDARTGLTPVGVASVTVVSHSLVRADVDATAAFARGPDALRWLSARPGATGLVVWADGRCETSGEAWQHQPHGTGLGHAAGG